MSFTFALLMIYLVIILVRPQEWVPALANSPLVFYTLILLSITYFFQPNRNLNIPQTILLALILIVINISSALNGWFGGGAKYSLVFISNAVLPFLLFSSLVTTPRRQHILMLTTIAAGVIMVSNGIDQLRSPDGIGWAGSKVSGETRITYLGIFNDPNDMGLFLVMCVPMATYFIKHSGVILKPIYLSALGLILYGIYLTNSRGAILSLSALLGYWFYKSYGLSRTIAASAFIVPVYIVLIVTKFRKIAASESSAYGRIEAWYEGFQMLKYQPVFGVGMDGFLDHHVLSAHNSYILVLAELGIVGFTAWLSFLIISMHMIYRVMSFDGSQKVITYGNKEFPIESEKELASTMFLSMIGFLAAAFFLSRSYTPVLYIYLGMAVACFLRFEKNVEEVIPILYRVWSAKLVAYSFGTIVFLYLLQKLFI